MNSRAARQLLMGPFHVGIVGSPGLALFPWFCFCSLLCDNILQHFLFPRKWPTNKPLQAQSGQKERSYRDQMSWLCWWLFALQERMLVHDFGKPALYSSGVSTYSTSSHDPFPSHVQYIPGIHDDLIQPGQVIMAAGALAASNYRTAGQIGETYLGTRHFDSCIE